MFGEIITHSRLFCNIFPPTAIAFFRLLHYDIYVEILIEKGDFYGT